MREDGAELRLVRRACSRLHLDQIRPHGLGAYDTGCFFFGLVDDVEFSMQRDPFALECANSDSAVTNWKVNIRRQFKSKWNWEPGD
jgi:hypothetical protein